MKPSPLDPSSNPESDLYERLLEGDPVASIDLAEGYLDRLADWLIAHNPRADPHDCATAAADAILALARNPRSYKPERMDLEGYLRMSALGDLKNIIRSEHRHLDRRAPLEAVELPAVRGNSLWESPDDPALLVVHREELADAIASAGEIPASVRATLTPAEEAVLALMQQKERRTTVFASALGISHQPTAVQRREVKRIKDRLKKRLERTPGNDG